MSSTFTIRIPRDLREKMRRFDLEWSEELRRFIENRVRQLELMDLIKDMGPRVEGRRVKVDSTRLIREDRER